MAASARFWLGRKDSNPRMPESKSGALTSLATPQKHIPQRMAIQPSGDETVHVRRAGGKDLACLLLLLEGGEYACTASRKPRGCLLPQPIQVITYRRVKTTNDRLEVVA